MANPFRRRPRKGPAIALTALACLAAGCSREDGSERRRRDLLPLASAASWEGSSGAVLGRQRLLELERGIAVIEERFVASEGRLVAELEGEGGPFKMLQWDLAVEAAPELLAGAEEPQLAGFDLPRWIDPSIPIDGEQGVFYVGPSEKEHVSCLRLVLPEDHKLPVSFLLRYAVEAPFLVGSALLQDADPGDVVRARHAAGERTTDGFAVPTGVTLRLPLPPHPAGRFCARVVADAGLGARMLNVRVDGKHRVERAFLAEGGEAQVRLALPATEHETELVLEATGGPGSILSVQEPRFEPDPVPEDEVPPNLCLVIVDTLRADRVGEELMPNLTEFAGECLEFEDCFSTCSWTLPSVTTMLTSNHGGQHQAWLNDQPLGEGVDTLAEVLRRRGYRTAAFTGGVFVDQLYGLDRGFTTFDSSAGGIAAVTERALAWLETVDRGPWFLLVHTYEVHAPYRPPGEVYGEVLARHPGVIGDRNPEPQAFHDVEGKLDGELEPIAALLSDLYDEGVRHADGVLGEFFGELRERGVLDGTLVALTSDHGEEFGEHGMLGHTDTLYREQLQVPLMLRFPGGAQRGRDSRAVSHLDLAPTLLDGLGLDPQVESFAGRSLLGRGEPSPIYATRHIEEVGVLRALREGDEVFIDGPYIYPRAQGGGELYDLAADRGQQRNLAGGGVEDWRERMETRKARFDEPKVEPVKISSDQVLVELRAMGYVE